MRCSSVGRSRDRIGQAGAALVEENQAREGRQPAEKPRERRLLPEIFEVRHPAHDEDEIDRAVAADLVGDVHVTAARVLDRAGCHGRRDRRMAAGATCAASLTAADCLTSAMNR